jgi:hypothetical protein
MCTLGPEQGTFNFMFFQSNNKQRLLLHKKANTLVFLTASHCIFCEEGSEFLKFLDKLHFSEVYNSSQEHALAQLVEALRYKPEGRRFNSRWCYWNFSLI